MAGRLFRPGRGWGAITVTVRLGPGVGRGPGPGRPHWATASGSWSRRVEPESRAAPRAGPGPDWQINNSGASLNKATIAPIGPWPKGRPSDRGMNLLFNRRRIRTCTHTVVAARTGT